MQEQILSQKLSQLLTAKDDEREPLMDRKRQRATTTATIPLLSSRSKKFRHNDDKGNRNDDDDDEGGNDNYEKDAMPDYLLTKKTLFDRMMEKNMDRAGSMEMDDMRQIAYFVHYIAFYDQLCRLWSTYLQAGRGELKERVTPITTLGENNPENRYHRCYWSKTC